jgi:hypothetical protein
LISSAAAAQFGGRAIRSERGGDCRQSTWDASRAKGDPRYVTSVSIQDLISPEEGRPAANSPEMFWPMTVRLPAGASER